MSRIEQASKPQRSESVDSGLLLLVILFFPRSFGFSV